MKWIEIVELAEKAIAHRGGAQHAHHRSLRQNWTIKPSLPAKDGKDVEKEVLWEAAEQAVRDGLKAGILDQSDRHRLYAFWPE
jgi:hypothetical protein